LCDDAGVLPSFEASTLVDSNLVAADGYATQVFHQWGIAPATTSIVGGPVSNVAVGGNVFPTGTDYKDLTGSGVAFIHLFGQCPPPRSGGQSVQTTNGRFILALTETRV
jgi:hypothetical protein